MILLEKLGFHEIRSVHLAETQQFIKMQNSFGKCTRMAGSPSLFDIFRHPGSWDACRIAQNYVSTSPRFGFEGPSDRMETNVPIEIQVLIIFTWPGESLNVVFHVSQSKPFWHGRAMFDSGSGKLK